MYVEVVSLREIKMNVDDSIVVEFQLSDSPDTTLREIIEAWPHPSHHTLTVDGSKLLMAITGGPQNAVASTHWLLHGRGDEGPPLKAMSLRYEQLIDVREALFAHLEGLLRERYS